jgi:hypothetical protein
MDHLNVAFKFNLHHYNPGMEELAGYRLMLRKRIADEEVMRREMMGFDDPAAADADVARWEAAQRRRAAEGDEPREAGDEGGSGGETS